MKFTTNKLLLLDTINLLREYINMIPERTKNKLQKPDESELWVLDESET